VASEELELLAFQITNTLTKSWGLPDTWELSPGNVSVIGLGHNPGSLDTDKLNTFLSLNYNQTRTIFNIERFEYEFKVLDLDRTVLNTTGIPPSTTAAQSVSVSRFVLVKDEPRHIIFTLWRE